MMKQVYFKLFWMMTMEITNSGLKKGRVVDKSQQDYHICSVVANWVALPPAQSTRHILNTHTNTRKGKRQELGSAPRLSACDQGSQESRQCGRPQGSTPPQYHKSRSPPTRSNCVETKASGTREKHPHPMHTISSYLTPHGSQETF